MSNGIASSSGGVKWKWKPDIRFPNHLDPLHHRSSIVGINYVMLLFEHDRLQCIFSRLLASRKFLSFFFRPPNSFSSEEQPSKKLGQQRIR